MSDTTRIEGRSVDRNFEFLGALRDNVAGAVAPLSMLLTLVGTALVAPRAAMLTRKEVRAR